MKSVFVFDWDGTLFDSMSGKTHAFGSVLSNWLSARGMALAPHRVEELYRTHSGRPRSEIFDLIAASMDVAINEAEKLALSGAIFEYNRVGLTQAPLFADTVPCLERLLRSGYRVFISSSVPQAELDYFVAAKLPGYLRDHLGAVLGSSAHFTKGTAHISYICARHEAVKESMLVVGDDRADYWLSLEAGVECVLVDRERKLSAEFPTIASLDRVFDFL